MPRRILVAPHLAAEELAARYRAARDPVERSQWQLLWLMAEGRPVQEVVAVTAYSPRWITRVVKRFNAGGAAAVGDQRRHNPGARPLLTADQQATLALAVANEAAPDGGLWTGPQVARWMRAVLDRPIAAQRGHAYLQRLGFARKVPRPRHVQADAAAQAAFAASSRPS